MRILALLLAAAYGDPRVIATLNVPGLNESSGLAASRAHPGVFWSHNDSGGGPYVYAFDRKGKGLGRWRVRNARANDWEAMAIGPSPKGWSLYIADSGDNRRSRRDITVYRVPEPDPRKRAASTAPAQAIRLKFPDGAHDVECLLVHPETGDLYLIAKEDDAVYKASPPFQRTTKLRRVGEVNLPGSFITMFVGRITGGDISPSGRRVVLCDYLTAWEAVVPKGANFDAIWKGEWTEVPLGTRKQGEAVAYRHDGLAILATSEGENSPLIEVPLKAAPASKK